MGREIEIKIPLSDSQYASIKDFILGKAKLSDLKVASDKVEHIQKKDEYYSRYQSRQESKAAGEPQVIRIRNELYSPLGKSFVSTADSTGSVETTSIPRSFFCIKRKSLENGIELNREDETFVENPEVIRDILTISDYHKFFEKEKDALSVYCKAGEIIFHLELEIVNGLKYVEVEVTDEAVKADLVRSALEDFIKLLGLDPLKKDSRSWMEILRGSQA